jgi:hypothetical protein
VPRVEENPALVSRKPTCVHQPTKVGAGEVERFAELDQHVEELRRAHPA